MTRSFDVFFEWVWMNVWVNNREAGDLRRHCAHYDVIVMANAIGDPMEKIKLNIYWKQTFSLKIVFLKHHVGM